MFVDKVTEAGGGGGEVGEEPGTQNQKQEPHTKMWGIILVKIRLLETIAIIKNNDNNNANKNELVKNEIITIKTVIIINKFNDDDNDNDNGNDNGNDNDNDNIRKS